MTEDIKTDELHPELQETAEEPKAVKKFRKMTEKLLGKVNGRINGERDLVRKKLDSALQNLQGNIDKFVNNSNDSFAKFSKRYEAMYSDLVRRVLVNMESRLFNLEIFNQAILDLMVERIYDIEKSLLPENADMQCKEDYIKDMAKRHEELMQKHVNEFSKRMKEQEEQKNGVAIQEEGNKDEDSKRGESEPSSETSSEDSGASDQENGGEAEQGTGADGN